VPVILLVMRTIKVLGTPGIHKTFLIVQFS